MSSTYQHLSLATAAFFGVNIGDDVDIDKVVQALDPAQAGWQPMPMGTLDHDDQCIDDVLTSIDSMLIDHTK